jgi:hypothetical protein
VTLCGLVVNTLDLDFGEIVQWKYFVAEDLADIWNYYLIRTGSLKVRRDEVGFP